MKSTFPLGMLIKEGFFRVYVTAAKAVFRAAGFFPPPGFFPVRESLLLRLLIRSIYPVVSPPFLSLSFLIHTFLFLLLATGSIDF